MKKIIWIIIILVLLLLLFLLARRCQHGDKVTSFFEQNTEGWTVSGDAQGGNTQPDYMKEGGKSGGYIQAKDDAVGGVWYWSAPEKFLGDISSSYGKKLKFSLKQSSTDSQFDDADIIFTGGGMRIVYDTPENPGTDWTGYTVILTEKGWRYNDLNGDAVTKEDFKKVLGDLESLYIRGEFVEGDDTDGLDNVILYK